MLQYLLNGTAIWLVSLLMFDLFLKKQSYHAYNRAYLLLSFITGLLLPLWQWQESSISNSEAPTEQQTNTVATLKQNIVQATPVQAFLSFENALMMVYALGVAVGLLLLLREALTIAKLYLNRIRSKDGVWTVVETGKKHSPFSAYHIIFISSKADYDTADLHTIMVHEQQHGLLFHFADLLLMQLGKVFLWFHPLVYLYHQRLMLVHEYQADKAAVAEPTAYGKFLLEQAMLHRAPSLTHSFNRSPIKNRIAMLTRSSYSGARFLLPLPLILVFMFCFTKNSFSGERKLVGNKLTFKGNVFEMKIWPMDTIIVEDPVIGEHVMKIAKRDLAPVTINGERIYEEQDVNVPVLLKDLSQNEMKAQLAEKLKPALKGLPDGRFALYFSSIVIDKKGKVVYYPEPYIEVPEKLRNDKAAEAKIQKAKDEMGSIISSLQYFEPAQLDTKPVAAYSQYLSEVFKFEVKNHIVTLVE